MYTNLQFFNEQAKSIPVSTRAKIGDSIFSYPFNYFFYQPTVSGLEANSNYSAQPQQLNQKKAAETADAPAGIMNPNDCMKMYSAYMNQLQAQNQTQGGDKESNNLRRGGNHRGNGRNGSASRRGNAAKSQGKGGKTTKTATTSGASETTGSDKTQVRQQGNRKPRNENDKTAPVVAAADAAAGENPVKKTTRKPKSSKPILDNEENFPLLDNKVAPKVVDTSSSAWAEAVSEPKLESVRQTRKGSADKRSEVKEKKIEIAEKTATVQPTVASRMASASVDKAARERKASESRERVVAAQQKTRERSTSTKKEDIVYVRKGKEIKVTYEKTALLDIFLKMRETITPSSSIIEASKDDFIPVIKTSAPKEIELTKPTEVDVNVIYSLYLT